MSSGGDGDCAGLVQSRERSGVSSYDRTHRFTTNFVWELPFWRDRRAPGPRARGWMISDDVHVAEWLAVHGIERVGSDQRDHGHRRPRRQRDPAEHQHGYRYVQHEHRGAQGGGRRGAVPRAVRLPERDLRLASASATWDATRCGRTASACSTSRDQEHADRRGPRAAVPPRDVQRDELAELRRAGRPHQLRDFLNQWGTDGGNRRSGARCATRSELLNLDAPTGRTPWSPTVSASARRTAGRGGRPS